MSDTTAHAIVTAEGHLVDSQLLKSIFDRVIDRGGDFEVLHFELGRTNDDFSRLTLKVSAPDAATLARLVEDLLPFGCHAVGEQDAAIRAADRDGSAAAGSKSPSSAWTRRSSSRTAARRAASSASCARAIASSAASRAFASRRSSAIASVRTSRS
jgi:hypothetical protein